MSTFESTATVDVTNDSTLANPASEPFVETADVTDHDDSDGEKEADGEEQTDAEEKPAEEEEKKRPEIDVSELRYLNVWKEANEEARKGVMDLWNEEFGDKMPQKTKDARLDLICVVCYHGEKVVAVSTMSVEPNEGLWIKIGFLRCMVHSDYRRNGIATQLVNECKDALSKFSKEHPSESLKALGATFSMGMLGDIAKKPVWPNGLTLVGYNSEGMQVRLAWLDDVEVAY
jgi:GNAT superfamily N-acetyltransferase